MTVILLYDQLELEERASRHLDAWKAWHIVMYAFAGVFGLLNYVFLQQTKAMVDNNCVFYPRRLEFHMVELPHLQENRSIDILDNITAQKYKSGAQTENNNEAKNVSLTDDLNTTKTYANGMVDEDGINFVTTNTTHRLMLDTSRTLFELDCGFAEYMPIVSLIFAVVWITMFTMCPAGGYSRSGLQQSWRIVAPALLFSLVMVGLTGQSFSTTNNGLHAFCAAFFNVTNATTCSSVEPYLKPAATGWGFGIRAAVVRGSAAGVLAGWLLGAALLLTRCLAGPDFRAHLITARLEDPAKKLIPHLKKNKRNLQSPKSPAKSDISSAPSEPTATTELVTALVETNTPVLIKKDTSNNEDIEMATTSAPQNL